MYLTTMYKFKTSFHILVFIILADLIFADIPTAQCPTGCVCRKRDVKCYALVDFPTSFPPLTTYIFMDELNIQTIPPDSFHGLSFLNTVEFQRSNFGSIPTCTFESIQSLEKIIFFKSVIGHLDKFAIFNITGPLTVEIKEAKITKWSSFAITSLPNMAALNIFDTTVYENNPMSIVNVSGDELSITDSTFLSISRKPFVFGQFKNAKLVDNKFEMIPCGALDNLFLNTDSSFEISGNKLQCDCGINYITGLDNMKVKKLLSEMYCIPNDVTSINQTVSEALNEQLVCRQKGKEIITNCKPESTVPVPKMICPSQGHQHGGRYNSASNENNNNGTRRTLIDSSFILLMFLIVSIVW